MNTPVWIHLYEYTRMPVSCTWCVSTWFNLFYTKTRQRAKPDLSQQYNAHNALRCLTNAKGNKNIKNEGQTNSINKYKYWVISHENKSRCVHIMTHINRWLLSLTDLWPPTRMSLGLILLLIAYIHWSGIQQWRHQCTDKATRAKPPYQPDAVTR
jgi:hypothetical protein